MLSQVLVDMMSSNNRVSFSIQEEYALYILTQFLNLLCHLKLLDASLKEDFVTATLILHMNTSYVCGFYNYLTKHAIMII